MRPLWPHSHSYPFKCIQSFLLYQASFEKSEEYSGKTFTLFRQTHSVNIVQHQATDTWENCFYSAGNTIEDDEFSVSTLIEKANINVGMFIYFIHSLWCKYDSHSKCTVEANRKNIKNIYLIHKTIHNAGVTVCKYTTENHQCRRSDLSQEGNQENLRFNLFIIVHHRIVQQNDSCIPVILLPKTQFKNTKTLLFSSE